MCQILGNRSVKIDPYFLRACTGQRNVVDILIGTVVYFLVLRRIRIAHIDFHQDFFPAVLRQRDILCDAGFRKAGTDLELDGVPFCCHIAGIQALPYDLAAVEDLSNAAKSLLAVMENDILTDYQGMLTVAGSYQAAGSDVQGISENSPGHQTSRWAITSEPCTKSPRASPSAHPSVQRCR